jgi:Ras-related protein Rab-18
VSTADGQQFADRMGSLFVEASAKTAVGVRDAFRSVVERIVDSESTPPPLPATSATTTRNSGWARAAESTEVGMPGHIDLSAPAAEGSDGCLC